MYATHLWKRLNEITNPFKYKIQIIKWKLFSRCYMGVKELFYCSKGKFSEIAYQAKSRSSGDAHSQR
jgi:hypothetical protein